MSKMGNQFSPDFRDRAVRMVGAESWDIAVIPRPASEGQLSVGHRTFGKTACSGRERARLADTRTSGSKRGRG